MAKFIDLSHRLHSGMPAYPGMPEPQFDVFLSHEQSAERKSYSEGTTFQMATSHIVGNTGTYVDAPFHRYPEKADLAGLPLEKLANIPGIVITALQDGEIGPEVFAGHDVAGKAVLVLTGWASRWGEHDYYSSGPYLGVAASEALVQAGAVLVGIDCANIDNMGNPAMGVKGDMSRPAHTILLGADIPIVEHMCALEELPESGFRFFAVPPAIEGGTSFPIRAFAIVD